MIAIYLQQYTCTISLKSRMSAIPTVLCYTDTNDAGDGHRDIRALVLLSHGDLEAKTFPAIPHMPHEMAWFNVSNRTSAAL